MMNRKHFLLTGSMITAASLASYAGIFNDEEKTGSADRRPDPDKLNTPILKALALGLNAPNPHNTQAWKFRINGPQEATFYVDETRLLPATDPISRQIHVGCGCFIALFEIGASHLGYDAIIDYLPEGNYGLDEVGKKPVAKLVLQKSEKATDPLYAFIFTRQTNRGQYHDGIRDIEFNEIIAACKPSHTEILLTNDTAKLKPMLEVLYKGMEVECYDWDAYDESRKWFRVKDDIAAKRDGLNLRASGMKPGLARWVIETMLSGYSKKIWHDEGAIQSLLRGHHEKVMSSKAVVTFKTQNNQVLDWVKCGRDYARFQLAATGSGFCMHPLSQVLQEYAPMKKLYDQFNQLMAVDEPAKIQMAVRMGKCDPVEYSYRREIKGLIINS